MGDNAKFTLLKDEALLRSESVGVSVADTVIFFSHVTRGPK